MSFSRALLALSTLAAGVAAFQNLPPNAKWSFQIGDPYTPEPGTQVVTRDRTASPVAGLYNICYINAFQTQEEDKKFWNGVSIEAVRCFTRSCTPCTDPSRVGLILTKKNGNKFEDPDWPGKSLSCAEA